MIADQTTVKFAPTAFLDSSSYLDIEETLTDVHDYSDVILNNANNVFFRVRHPSRDVRKAHCTLVPSAFDGRMRGVFVGRRG